MPVLTLNVCMLAFFVMYMLHVRKAQGGWR